MFPFATITARWSAGLLLIDASVMASVEERYGSREAYLGLVSQAALELADGGYLLAEDIAPILSRASEHWPYLMEETTNEGQQ